MPRVGSRVATLRHPLPPNAGHAEVLPPDAAHTCIRFAFLGLATAAKGFDLFVAAAGELKRRYGPAVEFHAVGRLPTDSTWDLGALRECLATLPSVTPVPRVQFDVAIGTCHYVCLPYRADHYTLSPSGVLLDAMAHSKPIIAGSTPAVRELFGDGSPGVLIDDLGQLQVSIENVIRTFSASKYCAEVDEMRHARQRRSLDRLAADYYAFTPHVGRTNAV